MSLKYIMAAAVALGLAASGAEAAPPAVVPAASLLAAAAAKIAGHEKASARCWWRNGQRYCRSIDLPRVSSPRRSHGGEYYVQDASKLPVGSQRWWDAKEREGSTGRP